MKKDFSQYIVVEFSQSQKCFHVETVGEMLFDGDRMMRGLGFTDFYPIRIFRRDDQARVFLDKLYEFLKTENGKSITRKRKMTKDENLIPFSILRDDQTGEVWEIQIHLPVTADVRGTVRIEVEEFGVEKIAATLRAACDAMETEVELIPCSSCGSNHIPNTDDDGEEIKLCAVCYVKRTWCVVE